jgi:hypothetical protein
MRLVKIKVPEGVAEQVVRIAHQAGIPDVGVYVQEVHSAGGKVERKDVVDIHTATPVAKRFLDALTDWPGYDEDKMSYEVREARAIVSSKDDVSRITMPLLEPAVDVLSNLWQFVHITPSFLGRVVVAALLLAYGIVHDRTLIMAAGLLFMPAMPLLLSVGFGGVTRSWRLIGRALLAMLLLTVLTVGAGYLIGLVTSEDTIKFKDFTPLMPSLALSLAIGLAAGIATTDDVGWKELIGLAAASQFSLIPAWFGAALVKGFGEGGVQTAIQRVESFALNTVAIIAMSAVMYAVTRMRAHALRQTEPAGARDHTVADDLQPSKMAA